MPSFLRCAAQFRHWTEVHPKWHGATPGHWNRDHVRGTQTGRARIRSELLWGYRPILFGSTVVLKVNQQGLLTSENISSVSDGWSWQHQTAAPNSFAKCAGGSSLASLASWKLEARRCIFTDATMLTTPPAISRSWRRIQIEKRIETWHVPRGFRMCLYVTIQHLRYRQGCMATEESPAFHGEAVSWFLKKDSSWTLWFLPRWPQPQRFK